MNVDLKSEVLELISRKAEGEYWDFKQQWHSNNADLLHDIICMANSLANRDCYIIIGVEDKTYNILGVSDENRKNQQNVIDLLRQKPSWAGGYIPEVYVRTIMIKEKDIDVVVIKRSDNTPFYLLKDYTNEGKPIFKGAIYTRKGDTNTPKTGTADLYDTELLWKRRLGLLHNPSQRAKFYLRDLDGWERVDGEKDKLGIGRYFFYYRSDPDYTIYLIDETEEDICRSKNINEVVFGASFYYLFTFWKIIYHPNFSNRDKVVLYYKDIPLFSSSVESVDEYRTNVIPPEYDCVCPFYIQDSFRYLMFKFIFRHMCIGYSSEAREMFLRVIPVYKNNEEHNEFIKLEENTKEEVLERLKNTSIRIFKDYDIPGAADDVGKELKENKELVFNFAFPNNSNHTQITEALRKGKMVVDWLEEWRNYRSDH